MCRARSSAAALVALTLVMGCDLVDGSDQHRSTHSADAAPASPFRWCRAGPQGGGYRIRAVGISCARVARTLPKLGLFRTTRRVARRAERDRDAGNRRVTEVVWRTTAGWACLAQPMPRIVVTQFLCVRGRQVILYRFT